MKLSQVKLQFIVNRVWKTPKKEYKTFLIFIRVVHPLIFNFISKIIQGD